MISSVGKHTYGHNSIKVIAFGEGAKVYIGNFCSISDNVRILLGGNHRTDWITTYPFHSFSKKWSNVPDDFDKLKKKNSTSEQINRNPSHYSNGGVDIRNDVWIGSGVTIMSGITIGDGAVIAANTHVVKNVEPYAIIGGNPGKLIRYRFTSEQITKLLQIKWWNWDDDAISLHLNLLCNTDIEHFIQSQNITPLTI